MILDIIGITVLPDRQQIKQHKAKARHESVQLEEKRLLLVELHKLHFGLNSQRIAPLGGIERLQNIELRPLRIKLDEVGQGAFEGSQEIGERQHLHRHLGCDIAVTLATKVAHGVGIGRIERRAGRFLEEIQNRLSGFCGKTDRKPPFVRPAGIRLNFAGTRIRFDRIKIDEAFEWQPLLWHAAPRPNIDALQVVDTQQVFKNLHLSGSPILPNTRLARGHRQ